MDNGNDIIAQRQQRLAELRAQHGVTYKNDFQRDALIADILTNYGEQTKEELAAKNTRVAIAGRVMTRRMMGKAAFVHIQDMSGQMQLYVRSDALPDDTYNSEFKRWDIGDIVGVAGTLMKTNKGELSVQVDAINLLTKSLRPLPEKFHGLTDQEQRYRQRYLDLIMNAESRNVFNIRSQVIEFIRAYLKKIHFIEVETPMMHALPGGAAARPFKTYHNELDMPLYLRIAPELYLKRLVVGGFERVFEINRSFRNEGLSTSHNPEFTMLEFYQAYATYKDSMDMIEDLLRAMTLEILGTNTITYQEHAYDLSQPFQRMTVLESLLSYNPTLSKDDLESVERIRAVATELKIPLEAHYGLGKIQIEIFEKTVEKQLIQPTFITAYPTEVSPLARKNDDNPFITDRFEFFIGGREIANGFSELNDPEDQAQRFREQIEQKQSEAGEEMHYDEDYITALEYGMPPAAGVGIGIDRLAMFLTNTTTIRDVILFPQMRQK